MEQNVNCLVVFAITVVIVNKLQETVHLLFRNSFTCHGIIRHHSYEGIYESNNEFKNEAAIRERRYQPGDDENILKIFSFALQKNTPVKNCKL